MAELFVLTEGGKQPGRSHEKEDSSLPISADAQVSEHCTEAPASTLHHS